MTENIAEKYIDEIATRYQIADKDRAKLENNTDQITVELGAYSWLDVRDAIEKYYRTKSDKHRPTLAQIVAVLESDPDVRKIGTDNVEPYHLPRTKLWQIGKTFDAVIAAMVKCAVLKPENPMDAPVGSGYSLLDDRYLPLINPMQYLRSQVAHAKAIAPSVFAPYTSTTFWEDVAIAVQNRLITLRVRDYAEMLSQLPADIRAVIRRREPGAASVVNDMIARWPGHTTVGVWEVR